jgi:hypothetical protein
MIPLEVRRFSQANDAQGGDDGALRGGENRPDEQSLHMHPDAFGEEWCEGAEQQYHRGRQGRHRHLLLVEWYQAYPAASSHAKWGKSSLDEFITHPPAGKIS